MTSACKSLRLSAAQDVAPDVQRPRLSGYGVRATIIRTTPLLALSRAGNFLFYVLLASRFGVTRQADGLFFTLALVGACGVIIGSALEATLVPVSCQAGAHTMGRVGALRPFFKLVAGMLAAMILTALFAEQIVGPLTGFDAAALDNVRILLLELVPVQFFSLWNCMMRGQAYALGQFVAVAWASVVESVVLIAAATLAPRSANVFTVPMAMLVSSMATTAILLLTGSRPPDDAALPGQQSAIDMPPYRDSRLLYVQVAGTGLASLNPLIDQMFASFLTVGAVSVYTYASRVFIIPVSGLLSGFLPIFLSVVSHARENLASVRKWVCQCLLYTTIGSCGIALVFCLTGKGFVGLAFQRGVFQAGSADNLYPLCVVLYAGLPSYVLVILLGRIHISLMNSRTIWMAAALNLSLNVILDWILGRTLGLNGIGLATTLDNTVVGLFLYWRLSRHKDWKICLN